MAALFVLVYAIVYKGMPISNKFLKGLVYGLLVWAVFLLPGAFIVIFTMKIPAVIQITWAVTALVNSILGGPIIAYIYKDT